ncbi:MAG: hypothetical protein IKR81_16195, partial [Victivallales bacterium]|nr:hypothetical protein [Victivallales bacterium]
ARIKLSIAKSLTASCEALHFGSTVNSVSGGFPISRETLHYFRICIALFNFQGASPFQGQQDITLHQFFHFANRFVVFFDFLIFLTEKAGKASPFLR